MWFRTCEFLKGKAWNFGDDIIDCRLERRRCDTSDVIVQLIQRVTHGEFRSDFRDGEPGGFGGKSRRS